MDYKGTNAGFIKPLESIPKFNLGPETSIRSIINITTYKQEIDSFFKTELDDLFKGLKSGRT